MFVITLNTISDESKAESSLKYNSSNHGWDILTDPGPRLFTWYSNECFSPALKEEFSFSTEN